MEARPIVYRELEQGQEQALLALYRDSFARPDPLVGAYSWWRDRPHDVGATRVLVAVAGDAVVGSTTLVPVELRRGADALAGAWQQATAVREEFRGRGVAMRLTEMAAEGFDLVLAKGTSVGMHGVRRSLGFCEVPHSTFHVVVLRATGAFRAPAQAVACAWSKLRAGQRLPGAWQRVPWSRLDGQADADLSSDDAPPGLRVHKSPAYLQWRYRACPAHEYHLIAPEPDRSEGVAVLRLPGRPRGLAWLVELVGARHDPQRESALVGAAIGAARDSGASALATFATRPRVREILVRHGFLDSRRSPRFTWRAQSKRGAAAVRGAEWDFWHGDGDTEIASR